MSNHASMLIDWKIYLWGNVEVNLKTGTILGLIGAVALVFGALYDVIFELVYYKLPYYGMDWILTLRKFVRFITLGGYVLLIIFFLSFLRAQRR